MTARAGPSGAVLMEAVVALAILGGTGIGLLHLVGQSTAAIDRAMRSEQEQQTADRFFRAATLWSRGELNQRLGVRRQGPWLLSVQRSRHDVFRLTLMDSSGVDTVLTTAVYRVERPPAPTPLSSPPDPSRPTRNDP